MRLIDEKKRFYSEKQLEEIAEDIKVVVTVPVNVEMDAEHRVYDFGEVKEILGKARRIGLQNCGCKSEYQNCDSPLDVCISLDDEADRVIEKGVNGGREITYNEALKVLERSHEAGLVHMAYVFKGEEKPGLLCSCCPCCCHTLGGLIRYGFSAQILTSKLIAEDDWSLCVNCGECVNRCVFGARELVDGELEYDPVKCFGCGLCVTKCPSGAIKMVDRKEKA